MNAHARPTTAINFRARSLMAFVLEPKLPLDAWLDELDSWLARSPNFFSSKPVILELAGLEVELMEYRELLRRLTLRHIRVMAVENPSRNLTGPHLPPTVTGGGQADAPTATEQALPAVAEQSASPAAIPAKTITVTAAA